MKRVRTAGLLLVSLVMMAGCRLDMHTQPKILPLTHSDFFEDGRGSRSLVPGTIARGQLRDDSYLFTGMINGKPGDMMPFPATKEVLERTGTPIVGVVLNRAPLKRTHYYYKQYMTYYKA